jgi:hypothetical protein
MRRQSQYDGHLLPERKEENAHLSVRLVLREHREPGNVGVEDEDHVRLFDESILAAESDTKVRWVVEREVDDGEARLENPDTEEVDEFDESRNGRRIATEVGGNNERLLRTDESVGDSADDLTVQRRRLERRPDLLDANVGNSLRVEVFFRRFTLSPDINRTCTEKGRVSYFDE